MVNVAPSAIVSESETVTGLSPMVQVVAEVIVPPCWSCAEALEWIRRKEERQRMESEYNRIRDIIDIPLEIGYRKTRTTKKDENHMKIAG